MKSISAVLIALVLVLGGCNRDPKVVSRKYVENGNKYFEKGKYKEASLLYRQALSKDRLNGDAYYRLGQTDLKLGRASDAYRSLLRANELLKGNAEVKTTLADLCLLGYLGDPKRPKRLLEEVEGLADELLKMDAKSFSGFRLKGYLALSRGQVEEALQAFQSAQSIKPFQRDVVIALVQLLDNRDRFDEGEKLARDLISREKGFKDIYNVLYFEYMKKKRVADAEAVLKLGIENNPKDVYFQIRLATHFAGLQKRPEMEAVFQTILSKPQEYPTGIRDVGDFYFRLGQLDQAAKYYEQGAKAAKDAAERHVFQKRTIEALVQQGKGPEATQLVESILKDDPKDNEAIAIRAALVLNGGSREQIDRAITELQSVLAGMPKNPVLKFNLGRAFLAKGDLEQAKLQFQDAITSQPDYLPARLALAQLHLLKGDYSAALSAADETLKFAPGNLVARLIRTSAMSTPALGNYDQARKELTEIARLYPRSRDARFQLGLLDFEEKKYKEAEAAFAKLREEAPMDPRSILLLAETYLAQGRTQQAIGMLEGELAKNPDREDLRLSLANIALRSADYPLAIKELTTLSTKRPGRADLFIRLGETYRQAGNYKAALESFKKAREIAPNDGNAHQMFALMLEATGQGDKAKPVYEQILKVQPDNVVALNNLAFIMAESGSDLDQALTLAQRAKQKLPNDANVADTLGWIYIKKNLSDDAIKIFRDLVQKNPTHVTWRLHLAMALYQKGDKLQARKELDTCIKNRPNNDESSKIKVLMGKLG